MPDGLEGLSAQQRDATLAKVVLEMRVHFSGEHQPRVMVRSWTWRDAQEGKLPDLDFDPFELEFATNPRRSWPRPQGPIIMEIDAVPGREYDAREWLDLL